MLSAATVLACTLSVLGRSESSFSPIRLVDVRPPEVTIGAEAFVTRSPDTIYLLTFSPVFQEAAKGRNGCWDSLAFKKLASILVHEQWHIQNGPDERGAYQAQLTTLVFLGVSSDSSLFHSVVRSMMKVAEAQNRARRVERLLAARELP